MDFGAIAGSFSRAWSTRSQFEAGADAWTGTAADAYRVQDKVFAARHPGQRARAWKAGASGPGAEPTGAPIGEVHESPAAFGGDAFHMIGIEAEVAYRLGRDLPARPSPWSVAEIAEAVSEVLVTIEICDTRLADWKAASALWRLADFQLNGALVTGSGVRKWREVDFSSQRAELWVNGRKVADRAGAHPLGDPFGVMPWAVAHCALRAGGLQVGDLVTTGSWTGMTFVSPGDAVQARFPGIGEASVRFG